MRDLDMVKREEFEAVKDMARIAREENEALKSRVAALEAALAGRKRVCKAPRRSPRRPQRAAQNFQIRRRCHRLARSIPAAFNATTPIRRRPSLLIVYSAAFRRSPGFLVFRDLRRYKRGFRGSSTPGGCREIPKL